MALCVKFRDGLKIKKLDFSGSVLEDSVMFVKDLEIVWVNFVMADGDRAKTMLPATLLVLQGHFSGTALVWFNAVTSVDISFDAFVAAFRMKFVEGAWRDRAFRDLMACTQKSDESVAAFVFACVQWQSICCPAASSAKWCRQGRPLCQLVCPSPFVVRCASISRRCWAVSACGGGRRL